MKLCYQIFLLAIFLIHGLRLFAQPKIINLHSDKYLNQDSVSKFFNSDTVAFESLEHSQLPNGIFITYERADTLDFKNLFYKDDFNSSEYTKVGLAFYLKNGNDYILQFSNPTAFFCEGCENMHGHTIQSLNDTVQINITWGPSKFSSYETYIFIHNSQDKHWHLKIREEEGSDDEGYQRSGYFLYPDNSTILLDRYDADIFPEDSLQQLPIHAVNIDYFPGRYSSLLESLQKIPENKRFLLPEVFNKETAEDFVDEEYNDESKITVKNVQAANEVGYYFEQCENLDAARIFLDKVINRFSQREVAYLNRGDVFAKMGKKYEDNAFHDYTEYVELMKERGLDAKIPKRIIEYINTHKD